jgi:hypothetical protein
MSAREALMDDDAPVVDGCDCGQVGVCVACVRHDRDEAKERNAELRARLEVSRAERDRAETELRHLRTAVWAMLNAWEAPAQTRHRKRLLDKIRRLKVRSDWSPDVALEREEAAHAANTQVTDGDTG